jgi:hypothetical protein
MILRHVLMIFTLHSTPLFSLTNLQVSSCFPERRKLSLELGELFLLYAWR